LQKDIANVYGCLYPGCFNGLHDILDAGERDGAIGSHADQGKIPPFHQDAAGDGPHRVNDFLLRPFRTLLTGITRYLNNPGWRSFL